MPKLGRRPAKDAPALKLKSILSSDLVSESNIMVVPDVVDYGAAMSGWQMLGNDVAGDCAAVNWANERYAVTSALGDKPFYPDQNMVWAVYKTQNPGFVPGTGPHGYESNDDQGMDMQTLQEYLHKTGGPDGVKSIAFAKVDLNDETEVNAAIALFGGLSWGVVVTRANEQQFANGQPWDYVPGSQELGGHAVYGNGSHRKISKKFVSWAEQTEFTQKFVEHQAEEGWVTIWPEHLGSKTFLEGVDINKLAEQYKAITGSNLPIPDQPPVQPPSGAASFPGALASVDKKIVAMAQKKGMSVTDYQNAHWKSVFRIKG